MLMIKKVTQKEFGQYDQISMKVHVTSHLEPSLVYDGFEHLTGTIRT